MNGLTLDCSLSTNGLRGSKIAATITNVFVEGATLRHNTLTENTADSPSAAAVDDIKLAWIPEVCTRPPFHCYATYIRLFTRTGLFFCVAFQEQSPKRSDLLIALYETQSRDRLVSLLPIAVPINERKTWTLAGVALFLRAH